MTRSEMPGPIPEAADQGIRPRVVEELGDMAAHDSTSSDDLWWTPSIGVPVVGATSGGKAARPAAGRAQEEVGVETLLALLGDLAAGALGESDVDGFDPAAGAPGGVDPDRLAAARRRRRPTGLVASVEVAPAAADAYPTRAERRRAEQAQARAESVIGPVAGPAPEPLAEPAVHVVPVRPERRSAGSRPLGTAAAERQRKLLEERRRQRHDDRYEQLFGPRHEPTPGLQLDEPGPFEQTSAHPGDPLEPRPGASHAEDGSAAVPGPEPAPAVRPGQPKPRRLRAVGPPRSGPVIPLHPVAVWAEWASSIVVDSSWPAARHTLERRLGNGSRWLSDVAVLRLRATAVLRELNDDQLVLVVLLALGIVLAVLS